MKKLSLLLTLSQLSIYADYTLMLPNDFCSAHQIAQTGTCSSNKISFASNNPVFLVLVHGTFSNSQQFLKEVTLSHDPIPDVFFNETAYDNQEPVKISFGWSGKNEDRARIGGGKQLAQGLNDILQQCKKQKVTPKIIMMGHSHGGNVIAVASNFIQEPIDYALFLATPVLRYNEKIKSNTEQDLYLPKSIKNLFLFYSMTDFVQTSGALTENFKRRYGPINGINLYNVRLLLEGQEPTHSGLYAQLVEDHILDLCKKIKVFYKKNKNLVANIDPEHPNADKLVAIKKYNPQATNPLTGGSTDALWPNWETYTYTQKEPDENELSQKDRQLFYNFYKKEFLDTAPLLDRTAQGIQQEVCIGAVGKLGSALAFLPSDAKDTARKYCCWSTEFKSNHPNATRALGCPLQAAPTQLGLAEDELLCTNVVGLAGRTLVALPQSAKNELKRHCCRSATFKQKHPNAAKAIGC
ncbi:MAG: hypothetical protein K2X90_04560 [Candidatus Babeliaceae bacterium]|nr:hypothetical protein [Candidatus Babeliaceae bacterium]